MSQTGLADLPLDQLTNPVTGDARCPGALPRRGRRRAVRRGPAADRAAGLVRRRRPDQRLGHGRADHPLHAGPTAAPSASASPRSAAAGSASTASSPSTRARRGRRRPRRGPPHAAERDDPVTLTAGTPVDLRFEFDLGAPRGLLAGALSFQFGTEPDAEDHDALIAEAARRPPTADVALVVVGTNSKVESEGFDRDTLALPGRQDDLVAAVAAANPRTVVVVNAGSPVLMPWRDEVAAVLVGYFGGQEFGDAVADVLLGAVEPGGRLPTTWATDERRARAVHDAGRRRARLHRGHPHRLPRLAQARRRPGVLVRPRSRLHRHRRDRRGGPGAVASGEVVTLDRPVENSGERDGKQVVQVYAERDGSAVDRPVRWLVGYAPVRLAAGESTPSTSRSRPGCSPTGPTAGPTSRARTRCGSAPASSTCRSTRPWSCRMSALAEPAGPRLQPGPERGPGRRHLLPGDLDVRVPARPADLPQHRPGRLDAHRQRRHPPGAGGRRGRADRRRRVGADDPSPRRRLLRHRHHRDEPAWVRGVHRDRPRGAVERRHHHRRRRAASTPTSPGTRTATPT